MMPEQQAIRKLRKKLDDRQYALELRQEKLSDERRALMRRCKHPNKRRYQYLHEDGWLCGDCGWES